MNDDVLLMVINMRSFECTVQKRIRICILDLIKTRENSDAKKIKINYINSCANRSQKLKKCLFKALF